MPLPEYTFQEESKFINEGSYDQESSIYKRVHEYDEWIKDNKINKFTLKKNTNFFKDMLKAKEKFLEKKHSEQLEAYLHNGSVIDEDPGLNAMDYVSKCDKRNTVESHKGCRIKSMDNE